jgi:hypothetical protein
MMHKKRRWSVTDVATPEELATELTRCTWCLCAGFRIGSYFFLNDSTSEDGAQEYAVVHLRDHDAAQIESVTVSWTTQEKLLDLIREALSGQWDRNDFAQIVDVRMDRSADHGRCHLCAG